jgi:hypothetical protein
MKSEINLKEKTSNFEVNLRFFLIFISSYNNESIIFSIEIPSASAL